jgi:hypothetical protein
MWLRLVTQTSFYHRFILKMATITIAPFRYYIAEQTHRENAFSIGLSYTIYHYHISPHLEKFIQETRSNNVISSFKHLHFMSHTSLEEHRSPNLQSVFFVRVS